jgi:hypothetical protein
MAIPQPSHRTTTVSPSAWTDRIVVGRKGYREAVKARPMVVVPADPQFEAVAIDVFLGTADAVPLEIEEASIVADIAHSGGGSVVVVARPAALDSPIGGALTTQIMEARRGMRETGWNGSTPTRAVICGADDEASYGRSRSPSTPTDSGRWRPRCGAWPAPTPDNGSERARDAAAGNQLGVAPLTSTLPTRAAEFRSWGIKSAGCAGGRPAGGAPRAPSSAVPQPPLGELMSCSPGSSTPQR